MTKVYFFLILIVLGCTQSGISGNIVFSTSSNAQISVAVLAHNMTNATAIQFSLSYNDTILSPHNVTEGSFLNENGTVSTVAFLTINETNASIGPFFILRNDGNGSSGNGTFATIIFNTSITTNTSITLSELSVLSTNLSQLPNTSVSLSITVEIPEEPAEELEEPAEEPAPQSPSSSGGGGGGGGGGSYIPPRATDTKNETPSTNSNVDNDTINSNDNSTANTTVQPTQNNLQQEIPTTPQEHQEPIIDKAKEHNSLLPMFGLILTIALGGGLFFLFKQKLSSKKNAAYEKGKAYVIAQQSLGYDLGNIKNKLREAGWKEEELDKLMKEFLVQRQ